MAIGVGIGEDARRQFADGLGLRSVLKKAHFCPHRKK